MLVETLLGSVSYPILTQSLSLLISSHLQPTIFFPFLISEGCCTVANGDVTTNVGVYHQTS